MTKSEEVMLKPTKVNDDSKIVSMRPSAVSEAIDFKRATDRLPKPSNARAELHPIPSLASLHYLSPGPRTTASTSETDSIPATEMERGTSHVIRKSPPHIVARVNERESRQNAKMHKVHHAQALSPDHHHSTLNNERDGRMHKRRGDAKKAKVGALVQAHQKSDDKQKIVDAELRDAQLELTEKRLRHTPSISSTDTGSARNIEEALKVKGDVMDREKRELELTRAREQHHYQMEAVRHKKMLENEKVRLSEEAILMKRKEAQDQHQHIRQMHAEAIALARKEATQNRINHELKMRATAQHAEYIKRLQQKKQQQHDYQLHELERKHLQEHARAIQAHHEAMRHAHQVVELWQEKEKEKEMARRAALQLDAEQRLHQEQALLHQRQLREIQVLQARHLQDEAVLNEYMHAQHLHAQSEAHANQSMHRQ